MGNLNMSLITDILGDLILLGIIHSIITYGLLKSISGVLTHTSKKDEDGDEVADVLSSWVKLVITYGMAGCWIIVFGVMGIQEFATKFFLALGTGIFSVALYSAAIKSILKNVPLIIDAVSNRLISLVSPSSPPSTPSNDQTPKP